MILTELAKLYDRLAEDESYRDTLPPVGMSLQNVSFYLVISREGKLLDVNDARIEKMVRKSKGKIDHEMKPRPLIVPGYDHPSGKGVTPRFLWDKPEYVLGFSVGSVSKSKKAREELFPAFRDYHLGLREKFNVQEPDYLAVCAFLESWNPEFIPNDVIEKVGQCGLGVGVFKVEDGGPICENPNLLQVWQKVLSEQENITGPCLVCGAPVVPIARVIETKIKLGDKGGSIASFNDPAYESYGKKQTYNSPISVVAGHKSYCALNTLLFSERNRIKIAETTVVFWTARKTQTEDVLAWILGDLPSEDEMTDPVLMAKLQSFWKIVRKAGDSDVVGLADELDTPFYMLGIEPNAARIVVRFWHESTLGDLVEKLWRHHEALRIEKTFPSDPDRLNLRQILLETAREAKNIPPLLSGAILRSVIDGTPYPTSLYQLILNRVNVSNTDKGKYKVGTKVTYAQASIIKAFLIRNKGKGEITVSLNTDNKTPAYLLGRLFATLEKAQDESSGGVNAGVGDNFYSSASATPKIVFPTVLDMYRKWQKKLAAEKPGRAIFFEKLVQEILDGIDSFAAFPANLTLEERGVFAIGYYQQMRSFFTKKPDAEVAEAGN